MRFCTVLIFVCAVVVLTNHPPQTEAGDERFFSRHPHDENNITLWPTSADGFVYIKVLFPNYTTKHKQYFDNEVSVAANDKIIEQNSCIKFLFTPDGYGDGNYGKKIRIELAWAKKCEADVGVDNTYDTVVTLSDGGGCEIPDILHEFMHALGFLHEMQRPDRDKYITVNEKNMKKSAKSDYEINPKWEGSTFTPYDYCSIMHYTPGAGSKYNDADVFKVKCNKKGNGPAGHKCRPFLKATTLSRLDVVKLNKLYKCFEDFPGCEDRKKGQSSPCQPMSPHFACYFRPPWKRCMKTCGHCRCYAKPEYNCSFRERDPNEPRKDPAAGVHLEPENIDEFLECK